MTSQHHNKIPSDILDAELGTTFADIVATIDRIKSGIKTETTYRAIAIETLLVQSESLANKGIFASVQGDSDTCIAVVDTLQILMEIMKWLHGLPLAVCGVLPADWETANRFSTNLQAKVAERAAQRNLS